MDLVCRLLLGGARLSWLVMFGEVVVVCDGSGKRNTYRMGAVHADYSWRSYVQCSWLVNCVRVASWISRE